MIYLFFLTLQALFYHDVNNAKDVNEVGSVVFVNLIWRHGERTPTVFHIPTDPYQNASFWPEGIGQLTNVGKQQQYELGQWLRRRYDALLTEEYSPDRVLVRSTDYDRTLMSAQVNLAGMFPPRGPQVWNNQLHWQPIPVHTTPEKLDKVLAAKFPCPAYDNEFERVSNSKEIKELYEKYQDIVDIFREKTGSEDISLKFIFDTFDTLRIEKRRGYSLPKWAEDKLPRMLGIAKYTFLVQTWNKKLARLKSGLLISEIIENMKNRTFHENSRVVNVYSAHDITISNFLNALGMYDGNIPPYAACLMVELREDRDGRHYVTIFYRNSTSKDPHLLTLPGCSAVCPLDEFVTLTQPLIPEDWDEECVEYEECEEAW